MTVPSTNVKFSDVWSEANGTYTSGSLGLNYPMSFYNYFEGPNGSFSVGDNNWGQGSNSGSDRIYGTSAKTTNIKVGDFKGLTYFYDQSQFKILINVTNNASTPNDDDVQVTVTLFDSAFTYSYVTGGQLVDAGDNVSFDISQTTTPIIAIGYWQVSLETTMAFTGSIVDISINGTSKVSSVSLPQGTTTFFDSNTYGVQGADGNGLTFDITIN
jgi:hypothetical protein